MNLLETAMDTLGLDFGQPEPVELQPVEPQADARDIGRKYMMRQLKDKGRVSSYDLVFGTVAYVGILGLDLGQSQARDILKGLISEGYARSNHDIGGMCNVYLTMAGYLS